MSTLHLSTTVLSMALTASAAVLYGACLLYGAWIDGRRQTVREQGLHPVTETAGAVHAREEEKRNGSNRG